MALLNLSNATQTLATLLAENIKQITDSTTNTFLVSAAAPDKLEPTTRTLSLHLYHIAEDPYYKNAQGPGNDVPNVAKTPMALRLFYILTAHAALDTDPAIGAATQQELMGYALKTFHDFPVITSRTRINGIPILHPDLNGDPIQVMLRPVTPEDAVAYWNSEQTQTTRLSAYYEVRVVMLEPERPRTMPGIVLNIGSFLLQLGSPHLESSQSRVRFRIPISNGGAVQEIVATPARVTLDSSASPLTTHNRLTLLGSNLSGGRSRSLVLKNPIWADLAPPDGPVKEAVVDPGQNPDWAVDFNTDRIAVQLAPVLRLIQPDGTVVELPQLPGSYAATVRSVADEKVVANELKRIHVSSNEVSFTVSARIAGHTAPNPAGTIQIELGPEFDLLDQNLAEDAIQVILAGEVYTRVNVDPPANEKEFFVTNNPSNQIRIRPHFDVVVTEPEAHPLLLIVNNAESAPFWIELNP